MEVYKDVKGFEGIYKVSDIGNVKSLERVVNYGRARCTRPEKILNKAVGKLGYCYVILSFNKIKKTKNIHRLVAENFLSNPENKPQVNHINGIKADNRVENLEWCTAKENITHAFCIGLKKGLRGFKSHLRKLTAEQVDLIRLEYSKGILSQKKIADKYLISGSQVNRIINKKNWF